MAPSTWGLRLFSRPSESRTLELIPSAAMTRSAGHSRPSSVTSVPSGRAPLAVELGHDLHARALRCAEDRGEELLAGDAEHARAVGAGDGRERHLVDEAAPGVAADVGGRLGAALQRLVGGADGLQHAHAVVPDPDAGAEGADLRRALVDAHAPAGLGQRRAHGEPGEAAAGDLRVSRHAVLAPSPSTRRPRPRCADEAASSAPGPRCRRRRTPTACAAASAPRDAGPACCSTCAPPSGARG